MKFLYIWTKNPLQASISNSISSHDWHERIISPKKTKKKSTCFDLTCNY